MFPVTITINTPAELTAVFAALHGGAQISSNSAAKSEATAAKKTPPAEKAPAATASADMGTTAAATAAPEQKASDSAAKVMTPDERTSAVKNAVAKVGRDKVVELISSYGAAKASEIAADKLAAFDAALSKLVA